MWTEKDWSTGLAWFYKSSEPTPTCYRFWGVGAVARIAELSWRCTPEAEHPGVEAHDSREGFVGTLITWLALRLLR